MKQLRYMPLAVASSTSEMLAKARSPDDADVVVSDGQCGGEVDVGVPVEGQDGDPCLGGETETGPTLVEWTPDLAGPVPHERMSL